jgi:hypothetical protein
VKNIIGFHAPAQRELPPHLRNALAQIPLIRFRPPTVYSVAAGDEKKAALPDLIRFYLQVKRELDL